MRLHQKRRILQFQMIQTTMKTNLNQDRTMTKNLLNSNKVTIRKVKKKRNKLKFKENKRKLYKRELYKRKLLRKRKLKQLLKRRKSKSNIRPVIESNKSSSKSVYVGIMPYQNGHLLTIITKLNLNNQGIEFSMLKNSNLNPKQSMDYKKSPLLMGILVSISLKQ